jgi:adenosine deaminase
MVLRVEQILERIRTLDRDMEELRRLRARLPANRSFTAGLQVSFDKHINDLLNERIALEELEVEQMPEDLLGEIASVDVATASRISVARETRPYEITAEDKRIQSFLKAMPKTEIHLHMEACISRDTLAGMLDKNGVKYEKDQLKKLYEFTNLQEFIKLFLFIIDSIKTPDDFALIFRNLRNYLVENNIRYAEVFLAPSRMIQNGLDYGEIAQTLDSLSRECRLSGGPDVRFLIDVSRTFGPENASKNLQRVLANPRSSIIGIGLGGAELMGPARDYAPVFAQAQAEGLRSVAHAGEDDGPWSIRDTVELLKAERIGHGTSAVQDPDLMELIAKKSIPIEICLTSNIFTGKYVRKEKDHPVRRYYESGIICTVNTDDPEIFHVDLSEEYFKFYKSLNFTVSELVDLCRMGVYSTFQQDAAGMWNQFKKEIDALRQTMAV